MDFYYRFLSRKNNLTVLCPLCLELIVSKVYDSVYDSFLRESLIPAMSQPSKTCSSIRVHFLVKTAQTKNKQSDRTNTTTFAMIFHRLASKFILYSSLASTTAYAFKQQQVSDKE